MDKVRCFGCGRAYEPTKDETHHHTHHIGEPVVPAEKLAEWLEECQRERDEALRDAEHCWETRGS